MGKDESRWAGKLCSAFSAWFVFAVVPFLMIFTVKIHRAFACTFHARGVARYERCNMKVYPDYCLIPVAVLPLRPLLGAFPVCPDF